ARRGSFRLEGAAQRRLRRRQSRDRHAEGRARDVVETGLATEEHRRRITAMIATDAELEAGARAPAGRAPDIAPLAHDFAGERGEGIVLEDAALLVLLQKRR